MVQGLINFTEYSPSCETNGMLSQSRNSPYFMKREGSWLSQLNPFHPSNSIAIKSILMLISHLCLCLSDLPFSLSEQNSACISHFLMCAACSACFILLDVISIWWRAQMIRGLKKRKWPIYFFIGRRMACFNRKHQQDWTLRCPVEYMGVQGFHAWKEVQARYISQK